MQLEHLLQDLPILAVHGDLHRQVSSVAYHSDQVEEGGVFVAIRGSRSDGHDFLRLAAARGAAAMVVGKPVEPLPGVTIIRTADTRIALAEMANRYYDFPSRRLTLVGVTGTNGKTTTASLLEAILSASGHRVGVIGTLNIRYTGRVQPAPITTPESLDLQRVLREMLDAGVTHVVMEVSSHGLDMYRVHGSRFAVGVFTNLSQDHLDHHGTMDNYFEAKARLFCEQGLGPDGSLALAVINGDDQWGQKLCSRVRGPILRYGLGPDLEVRAAEFECHLSGTRARVHTSAGEISLYSPLLGRLNLYNLLAAVAAAVGLGLPLEAIRGSEQFLTRVPGRLEAVPNDAGFQVLVDYAHTPDALEKALDTLRDLPVRRLICVFGCGGDRDRGKRPLMGAVAARRADFLVVTSDNPRSEPPEAIMSDIEAGIQATGLSRVSVSSGPCCNGRRCYTLMPDRREAIRLAIHCAQPGDVVYIGGKGHENYQIIGDHRIEFDDRQVALEVLRQKCNYEGKTAGG